MSSELAFLLIPVLATSVEAAIDRFVMPQANRLRIKTEPVFLTVSAFTFASGLVGTLLLYDYLTVHDLYAVVAVAATLIGGGIGVVRGSKRWDQIQRDGVALPNKRLEPTRRMIKE